IGAGSAGSSQCSRPAAEENAATGAPTALLGLKVIQFVFDQICAEADVVGTFGPARVRHVGVDAVVPLHGAPGIGVADRFIAGDADDGETALANVGTVGAGNAENIRAYVPAKIRPLGVVVHPGATPVSVHQKSRRKRMI